MPSFIAFSPNVEVSDKAVLAVVNGVPDRYKELMHLILKKHHIDLKNKQEWYKQQDWLNVFKEIADNTGANTLFGIGKAIPETAILPFHPSLPNGLHEALESIDKAYQLNHQGGEIGYYRVTEFTNGLAVMECKNPYPSDFDRGVITSVARNFMPLHSLSLEVKLDTSQPSRLQGADACSFLISWKSV